MQAATKAFGVLLAIAIGGARDPLVRGAGLTAVPASSVQSAAASVSFAPVGTIPGPADLIEVRGNRAYIVAGETLRIFDVSTPAAPRPLGEHTFPEKIWGIRIVGSRVYAAADFYGLGILEVSAEGKPALVGAVKTPGQAKNVAVVGTMAAVADHMSGIDFIDVSDAAKPVVRGSFFLEGYARDVSAIGGMAYAVDAPAGVYAFDLSKPGELEPVHSQQSATAPGSIELAEDAPGIAVLVGGGAIQVYDLSKPAAPARIAAHKTPSGRPLRAALSGSRAYVADGREGLQVIDLSAPAAPRSAGSYPTPTPARDVAVAGALVFVVMGAAADEPRAFKDQEVLILRQTAGG